MPISQERMKQLVDAAQSIISTHIGQCATLGELAARYRAGKATLEELLEYVEMRNVRPDAAIASEMITVNNEHYRWLATHNRNGQEARRLARRRAEARGEEYTGEPTRAPVYKPRQKTAKAEPKIQSNARELEAASEPNYSDDLGLDAEETQPEPARFPLRPGFDLPESICPHEMVVGGGCLKCGKEIGA